MKTTRIRDVRQDKGLTLADVAKRLDTTPATVSRWEREPNRVTVPVLSNLARVLDVDPSELLSGVRQRQTKALGGIVMIRHLTYANAHPSASNPFDAGYIAELTDTHPDDLAIITVHGDAMHPTLSSGDQCLVDLTITAANSAGMYAIRHGDYAAVVRLTPVIGTSRVRIIEDNPAYSNSTELPANELQIVGRVIWIGKRV